MPTIDTQRRLRIAYAIVALLLAIVSTHWIFVNARELGLTQYLRDVNCDDSFYYLKIGKNLASGHFSTFDGQSRTNGHHPLWTVVLAGVHEVASDPLQALRIAKCTEFLLLAFSALSILATAYRARSFPLLWCWTLFHFFSELNLYLGLEAALQLALLSAVLLTLAFYRERDDQQSKRIVTLAYVLSLALIPWVRLETIVFAICVACVELPETFRVKRFAATLPLLAVLISTAAYFSLNRLLFDSFVPVSGELKNLYSNLLWSTQGGRPGLLTRIKDQLAIGHVAQGFLWCAAGVSAVALTWSRRRALCAADKALDAVVLGLVAAHVARVIYSVMLVHPRYAQYGWYYAPALMLKALAVPLFAHRLLVVLGTRVGRPVNWALSLGVAAILALMAKPSSPYRLRAAWLGSTEFEWERVSHLGVEWTNANLPDGAVIGSEDAGVIGYFSRHTVVNLDGLVNSTAFARALEAGLHREALNGAHVTHIANVMVRGRDCYAFAKMGDSRPLLGRLTLLHEGPTTSDNRLVFRVCAYQPQERTSLIGAGR